MEFEKLPPMQPLPSDALAADRLRTDGAIVLYPIAILGPRRAVVLRRRWAQADAIEFGYLDIGGEA